MLVTPSQMQTLERLTDEAGISYAEMMERAGTALADVIRGESPQGRTCALLAGSGNNGGDCYVAAAHLARAGWTCTVIAPLGAPKTDISRAAAQRAADLGVRIVSADDAARADADVLVDGLFGTGFRGELPAGILPLLERRPGQRCIACDIPSGGSGLTGSACAGTFRADVTVTFGARKLGLSQYPLREFCGRIQVADIGIPADAMQQLEPPVAKLLDEAWAKSVLPARRPDAHKNDSGHVLVVAGSVRMRGACVLAAEAAMRSGAGLATCASAEPALQALCARVPEIMCLPLETDGEGFLRNAENHAALRRYLPGKSALLVGCGLGLTENTCGLTKFLLRESRCPVILDADGLNAVASCIEYIPEGRTVLTPHPGEAARLLGVPTAQVQADRPAAARELARRTGAVSVLKGAGTIVTDGVRMAVCPLGNAGMARAGSGDVLAGMTAAFAAQGMPLYEAACAAVTLHARAGDAAAAQLPMRYMLPQDLIRALAQVL